MAFPGMAFSGTGSVRRAPVVVEDVVWDGGLAGSWSAFTTAVKTTGLVAFKGELRLVPVDTPSVVSARAAARAAQRLLSLTQTRLGVTTPTTTLPPATVPRGSDYRVPLTVEPGVKTTVSVLIPFGDNAYRPEVFDVKGELVALGNEQVRPPMNSLNVGLLSDRPFGDGTLRAAAGVALGVSRRFHNAADFPTSVAGLQGLDLIVVDDVDSSRLDQRQRDTLGNFVALGGSVVVGGGAAAARNVAGLPDTLVPLSPTTTGIVSLGPISDLVGAPTAATTTVATGVVRSGRVVLAGAGGPPLVVEAEVGAGRVIQLAYDPLAMVEKPNGFPVELRTLPLSTALLRVAHFPNKVISTAGANSSAAPKDDQTPTAASLLEVHSAPGGPPLALPLALLVAYAFGIGPGLFLALGGGKAVARVWMALPVGAFAVASLVFATVTIFGRQSFADDQISVERIAGATGRVDAYHLLDPRKRGTLGASLAGGGQAFVDALAVSPRSLPDIFGDGAGPGSFRPGPDGTVRVDPRRTRVEVTVVAAGDNRSVHTLSASRPGVVLESHLSLRSGHLVGTITNHGTQAVRRLQARTAAGGHAELAPAVRPGATVNVDAAFDPPAAPQLAVPAVPRRSGPRTRGQREDALLDLAARPAVAETTAGQVALVGIGAPASVMRGHDVGQRSSSLGAVVTAVDLEGADAVRTDLGFGAARLMAHQETRTVTPAVSTSVYEFLLPRGMVRSFTLASPTGSKGNNLSAEVYDFDSFTWRSLPVDGTAERLRAGETKDGLVRGRAHEIVGAENPLQLSAVVVR